MSPKRVRRGGERAVSPSQPGALLTSSSISEGSISDFPECSGVRGSGVRASEESDSEVSGSDVSDFRAGEIRNRGHKVSFDCQGEPPGGNDAGEIQWEYDIGCIDVENDDPRYLLKGVSSDRVTISKLVVLDCNWSIKTHGGRNFSQ